MTLPAPRWTVNSKYISDSAYFKHAMPEFTYVDMIEPHLVLQKSLNAAELYALGKELNSQRNLFPHGINVNACHMHSDGTLFVYTYERGVQGLTQSCGTGSMSCAALLQRCGAVHVTTPGGKLEITMLSEGIELIGNAAYTNT